MKYAILSNLCVCVCVCICMSHMCVYVKMKPYVLENETLGKIDQKNFFCKELDHEVFKLCGPHKLFCNYQALPLWHRRSHRQYRKELVRLCSNRT